MDATKKIKVPTIRPPMKIGAEKRNVDAECPHCHAAYEVTQDELGKSVVCERCKKSFTIRKRISPVVMPIGHNANSKLSSTPTSELALAINQIIESSKKARTSKEVSSYRNKLIEIKSECENRCVLAKREAIKTFRQRIPFLFRPLAFLLVFFRSYSEEERQLKNILLDIEATITWTTRQITVLFNKEQAEAEEARKRLEATKKEAMCASVIGEITKLVQTINENKQPNPICYDHDRFAYQAGETMFFISRDVVCEVPHKNKEDERYCGGTFVITNKRVVYTSESHIQTYRMKNIRDFTPCWQMDEGWIIIATSEKRRERYKLDSAWKPTLLILFFANNVYREMLLTQSVQYSVEHIWNKIKATTEFLQSWTLGGDTVAEKRAYIDMLQSTIEDFVKHHMEPKHAKIAVLRSHGLTLEQFDRMKNTLDTLEGRLS